MPLRTKAAMSSTDAASLQCRSSSTRIERLAFGDQRQEPPDGAMRAMALVAERRGGRPVPDSKRRQDPRDVGQELGVRARARCEFLRGDVGVQRLDPHAVGQVALELGGGAGEDEMAALFRPAAQLGEQPGLADARLALDREAGGRAGLEGLERGVELLELGPPPHHRIGLGGNGRDREHTPAHRLRPVAVPGVVQGAPLMFRAL